MNDPFPSLPARVRQYEIIEQIGHGGFGFVYKVHDSQYNIDFAMKALPLQDGDNSGFKSFEAEVQALLTLDHPNVIRLYNYFEENNIVFLVLELCPGGTLENKLMNNTIHSVEQQIFICYQIVDALAYIHSLQIAHRDIKPSNVLFDRHGRVKIADFGLCTKVRSGNLTNSFDGSLIYAAPEIFQKISYNPFFADSWSLGVMIYRIITGDVPWPTSSKEDLRKAVLMGNYPPPKSTHPLSRVIKQLIIVHPPSRTPIVELIKQPAFQINQQTTSLPMMPHSLILKNTSSRSRILSPSNLSAQNETHSAKFIALNVHRLTADKLSTGATNIESPLTASSSSPIRRSLGRRRQLSFA